jgi:integrase
LDALWKEVTHIAKNARIAHVDTRKPGKPPSIRGNLHDIRGTFAARLMTTTDLIGEEVAEIMGWSPEEVRRIRAIYVDDHARNVALGRRIARGSVNRDCKPAPRERSGQR